MKDLRLIQFFSFLSKTNYFPRINVVVIQAAVAKINYSPLSIIKTQLSIIHSILADFQSSSLEVKPIFLDISKALDKVWHEGVVHKLDNVVVLDEVHKLFQSFLSKGFQIVVCYSQSSTLSLILADILGRSICGSLFFLSS